jgi:hypothetical protein
VRIVMHFAGFHYCDIQDWRVSKVSLLSNGRPHEMGLGVQTIGAAIKPRRLFPCACFLRGFIDNAGVPDLKREDGLHRTLFTSAMGGFLVGFPSIRHVFCATCP